MSLIKVLDNFPDEFFEIHPRESHRVFGGPTLIHLKGKIERPIFISTLLHGNETTGFFALQEYFRDKKKLDRSVIILIGNTRAAEQGLRKLPEQVDFNRVWHPDDGEGEAWDIATAVRKYCREHDILLSADIHNNTGRNPYYGCINKIEKSHLHLASLFSPDVVYFTEPHEVLSLNFANFCPSTTVEVGLPGLPQGIEYAVKFIEKLMKIEHLDHNFDAKSVNLFHTIGRMKVDHDYSMDFDEDPESEHALSLLKNFDENNFQKLPKGMLLGYRTGDFKIKVLDNDNEEMTDEFFDFKNNKIVLKQSIIPSMFTKVIQVIKDDCLGYLMEKIDFK